jgi:hypothetical protein
VAALPARISTTGDARLPVEDDLALGRVAAAYLVGDGDTVHVVVTTAVDGKHHLVSLPDFPRASDHLQFVGNQDLRLSPDGTQLAYVYRQYDATPAGTGIAVVDLESGSVRAARSWPSPGRPTRRTATRTGSSSRPSTGRRAGATWCGRVARTGRARSGSGWPG